MNRSTAPKVRIPTVDEVESSLVTSKTNFTKFRQPDSSSNPNSAPPNNNGASSSSFSANASKTGASSTTTAPSTTTKRKPEDESTKSIDNYFPALDNPPSIGPRGGGSSIIVNNRQMRNPLLRFLRNVPYEFGQTPADYILGESCCALFLSLKFHKLHPDYVHERLKEIGHKYALQVLLVQIDIPEPDQALRELNTICFNANWTFMLAWSPEEAAELLESYKIYENKPPDFLMGKQETDPRARLVDLLTNIKSITRTDAENLIVTFGSLKNMVEASEEQLAMCPGLGMKKAKRLFQAFGAPWRGGESNKDLVSFNVDDGEGTSAMAIGSKSSDLEINDLFEEDV